MPEKESDLLLPQFIKFLMAMNRLHHYLKATSMLVRDGYQLPTVNKYSAI